MSLHEHHKQLCKNHSAIMNQERITPQSAHKPHRTKKEKKHHNEQNVRKSAYNAEAQASQIMRKGIEQSKLNQSKDNIILTQSHRTPQPTGQHQLKSHNQSNSDLNSQTLVRLPEIKDTANMSMGQHSATSCKKKEPHSATLVKVPAFLPSHKVNT